MEEITREEMYDMLRVILAMQAVIFLALIAKGIIEYVIFTRVTQQSNKVLEMAEKHGSATDHQQERTVKALHEVTEAATVIKQAVATPDSGTKHERAP